MIERPVATIRLPEFGVLVGEDVYDTNEEVEAPGLENVDDTLSLCLQSCNIVVLCLFPMLFLSRL